MLNYKIFSLFVIFNINFIFANEMDMKNIEISLYEKDPIIFNDIKITKTKIDSIYKLNLKNGDSIYYNFEKDFFMNGDLLTYNKKFINLTKQDTLSFNKKNIDDLKEKYKNTLVHYKSNKNPSIMSIFVFSDYTCPFCKKLHNNIELFQNSGIEVYYIPFPRKSINDYDTVRGLQKIICSKNKTDEFSLAFKDPKNYSKKIKNTDIECPEALDILQLNKYADIFKVNGTPTTITDNGSIIHGFNTPEEFAYKLRKIMENK